ncbi:MAG: L,D-transpeptidase [Anaerolineae bacterium]|nr:L,D-transpeptidase [Anaerolineae bacterium]
MKKHIWLIITVIITLIAAAPPDGFGTLNRPAHVYAAGNACAELDADHPASAACNSEIAAHPLPKLAHPVAYVKDRDGKAIPRSILIPESGLAYPVGWQRRAWYYSAVPGDFSAENYTNAQRIPRQTMFYIYHSVEVDGEVWHLIGPGQWMRDQFVSVLQIPARPAGVTGRWVALDLNQQTLLALEDDTPVFASLISSGYYLETTLGLFQIYGRTESMLMQGPPGANPPLYSFKTKWVMFFNGHQGMHAMPYHNDFGMKRSHGCVNVPPGDELWLWNWLAETEAEWDPGGATSFMVDYPDRAPWVYVYESPALPVWE